MGQFIKVPEVLISDDLVENHFCCYAWEFKNLYYLQVLSVPGALVCLSYCKALNSLASST